MVSMWVRIWAVLLKELKQLSRDKMTFGMIVMIPLVQLLLFGFAINNDARHIPVGLVDLSQSSESRALIAALEATQSIDIQKHYTDIERAQHAIVKGEVRGVLYLPSDFVSRLVQHPNYYSKSNTTSSQVFVRPVGQWLVDGSDTVITSSIKALQNMPLQEIGNRAAQTPINSFAVVPFFNPEQRTVVNIVPGLVGVILTMTMILFTSAAIVREREQGNMEFLINTPIRSIELMLGKITPYVLVGLIQVAIILGIGHWIFSLPIKGSIVSLFVAALLFIFASLTLGLLISTIAKSQLQAMQMTIFILLPSILLSGFMFPYEAMPNAAQWVAECLPATHFMRMIRAIVLRDAMLTDLFIDSFWLMMFTLLVLTIATFRFRKKLA